MSWQLEGVMISAAMQVRPGADIELDLHGYHPDDVFAAQRWR